MNNKQIYYSLYCIFLGAFANCVGLMIVPYTFEEMFALAAVFGLFMIFFYSLYLAL